MLDNGFALGKGNMRIAIHFDKKGDIKFGLTAYIGIYDR